MTLRKILEKLAPNVVGIYLNDEPVASWHYSNEEDEYLLVDQSTHINLVDEDEEILQIPLDDEITITGNSTIIYEGNEISISVYADLRELSDKTA